jgi:uncharacterized membrane protein
MEGLFILLALGVGLFFLIAPVLGVIAFIRAGELKQEIAQLRAALAARPAAPAPAPAPAPGVAPVMAAPVEPTREPAADVAEAFAQAPPPPPPAPPAPKRDLEQRLTGNLLVWLGGGTLALGGAFLVRYSIEQDLIGPGMRIALGLLLALALVAGAEWLRRRPAGRAAPHVPVALAGAGVFTAFASTYAAEALYGLLGPSLAFLCLGAVAAVALALALLQGPLLALLGLVAGYATPLLVSSTEPAAGPLFAYLAVLTGAVFALVRLYRWVFLGWVGLLGAVLWPMLWFATAFDAGESLVLVLYAAALLAASVLGCPRDPGRLAAPGNLLLCAGAAAVGLLLFVLLRMDLYGPSGLVALAAFAAALLLLARADAARDPLLPIAALAVLCAYATWHLPAVLQEPYAGFVRDWRNPGIAERSLLPPELDAFAGWGLGFALLFGAYGFRALWGAARPWLWAGASAGVPLLLLAIAYWRVVDFNVALHWAGIAVALAAGLTFAAERVARHRAASWANAALGAYAAGITGALALAFVMVLREAWLTVALSLQVAALAWIAAKLDLRGLRPVALAVAGIVLVRLLLNHHLVEYPLGAVPLANWITYGYGLPAAAFLFAAQKFRRQQDDALVAVLEAGALAFAVAFVTLQLRDIAGDGLDSDGWPLAERAFQALAWLAMGVALHVWGGAAPRPVARWGAVLLCGLGGAMVLLGQVLVGNPLWTGEAVGRWPVLNLLGVAYTLPALLAAVLAWNAHRQHARRLAGIAFAAVPVLLFVAVSLEVRRAFQGSEIAVWLPTSDAEWYAYSAAWLLFAGVLLGLGLRLGVVALRYASLALVLLTVAKVFLFDMAALGGLYRALSFIGLGLCLLGIVWLYARFVFPRKPVPE